MAAFLADVRGWIDEQADAPGLDGVAEKLVAAVDLLEATTAELLRQAGDNPDAVNANAVEYLDLFGYVTYAWLWARMMVTAAGRDDDFGRVKLNTGRFYFERLLPRAGALAEQIKAGADTMMSLDADLF